MLLCEHMPTWVVHVCQPAGATRSCVVVAVGGGRFGEGACARVLRFCLLPACLPAKMRSTTALFAV